MRWTASVGLAALVLAGCDPAMEAGAPPPPPGLKATAALRTATGEAAGRATATDVAGGVRFTLDVAALPPGTHGAHVHMVGRCDPPGFESAGGHWNPTGAKHGTMNPAGPHQGDLPNLIVGPDGRGTLSGVVIGASVAAMLDADGAAMMVHAGADDLMTDPSGNSGARIACGVFAPA
jgi:superoxide dismutase, Cu-Zn family